MFDAFEVVARHDEAIDVMAMSEDERSAFAKDYNPKHLHFVAGEKPTRWFCRRLRNSEMMDVLTLTSNAERFQRAFAIGLTRATDVRYSEGDEVVRRNWVRPENVKTLGIKALDEFDIADIQEVGAAIFGRSHLGKGRPAAWPQPDTFQLAAAALGRHLAARTLKSAETSLQNSPPVAEAQPARPDSSPVIVTDGAVTATG